ncbi:hypothetical protein FB45DRAFT_886826 [Roridomyces roridus]|uniref:BHLH domain-containing protein n=1 Tax=Roridomyces roridus TaxID=1738132 RepID=A0AAD7G1S4_9AGAR|nr:hypothetical protein FB45DRAFT_886826 [Roridomyces roridus]
MSLLTKSESQNLHAFLDTMDYANGVSKEWAMYAAQLPEQESYQDKTALRQATKDLMALDAPRYTASNPMNSAQNVPPQMFLTGTHLDYLPSPVYQRQPSFPFLNQQRPALSISQHAPPPPRPYSQTPTTASSSSSSFTFPVGLSQSSAPRAPSPKRNSETAPAPPTAVPAPKRNRSSSQPSSNKPALLSPSQKKANHIQSEQKRRANIRRGYEALCESVPALREAIREEEATAALAPPSKGKRTRGRSRGDDSDKVDGRSGPRSENVVLSKTIDYVTELLADQESLRGRLERARAALPHGHPARTPLHSAPLWEREWKGGEGHMDEDADEEEDDSP